MELTPTRVRLSRLKEYFPAFVLTDDWRVDVTVRFVSMFGQEEGHASVSLNI